MKEGIQRITRRFREIGTVSRKKLHNWIQERKGKLKKSKNEKKQASNKRNLTKYPWRDWISVGAQVGTMIAAIVALFALRETRIQRESMYKPNLSIADGVFYADISDIKSIKYYQDGIDTLIMGHTPAYILQNFGMGSAVNVMTRIVFTIKSLDPYLSDDAYGYVPFDRSFLSDQESQTSQEDSIIFRLFHTYDDGNIDYVLPLNQSTEKVYRYFESDFIDDIILTYLCAVMTSRRKGPITIPIDIDFSYQDINSKRYKKHLAMFIICSIENENRVKCIMRAGLRENDLRREFRKRFKSIDIIKLMPK